MKINSKISAFTLMEATINLTIMSIIVGVVYFTYTIFSKQLFFYSKQNDEISWLNQIDVSLKFDLHNSTEIEVEKNKIKMFLGNNSIVEYEIINHKLVRYVSAEKDYFETIILGHSLLQDSISHSSIAYFSLDFKVFNDTIHAVYSKDYGISNNINNYFLK